MRDDDSPDRIAIVARALDVRPSGADVVGAVGAAFALLIETLRAAGPSDYAAWAEASPFKAMRPSLPSWDEVASRLLEEEIRLALAELPTALLVAKVPDEARRSMATVERQERDRRSILRRQPGDVTDETVAEPTASSPDEAFQRRERERTEAERAAKIEALLRSYPKSVRLALRATVAGATNDDAARVGRLSLRAFKRHKMIFIRQLRELRDS